MPRFPPHQRDRMVEVILIEIVTVSAERSRGRHNPRVVKRKMSNFPTKSRTTPSGAVSQPFHYPDHICVVAPPEPPAHPSSQAAATVKTSPQAAEPHDSPTPPHDNTQNTDWRDHVRAWRNSGLSRMAYCQRHDLPVSTFHQWVARLRPTFQRPRKTAEVAA
jgi:hypothetical protein